MALTLLFRRRRPDRVALMLSFFGMRSESFPSGAFSIGIVLVALLVGATACGAVELAQDEASDRADEANQEAATEVSQQDVDDQGTGDTESPTPANQGAGPKEAVDKSAEKGGGSGLDGAAVFVDTGCGSCHSLAELGSDAQGTIGPNLDEALVNKDEKFIQTSIEDPSAYVARASPTGRCRRTTSSSSPRTRSPRWSPTWRRPPAPDAEIGSSNDLEVVPRHHVRVPDERARLRADAGDARLARLRGGGEPRRRRPDPLQHLLDPRVGRQPLHRPPRRGEAAEVRRPRAGRRRRRLLGAVGQGRGLPALSRSSTSPSGPARSTSWPSSSTRDSLSAQGYFEFEDFSGHLPTRREREFQGWLQISQGCNCVCSYCIVPSTRGREVSRDPRRAARRGRGAGRRRRPRGDPAGPERQQLRPRPAAASRGSASPSCCARVDAVEGIERIRYTSPHPKDMKEDVIRAHAELRGALRAHPPAAAVGLERGPEADAPHLRPPALHGPGRADPRARPRLRDHHRHHRRLPGRDRGRLRRRRSRSSRRSATTAPSPSSSRRGAKPRRRRWTGRFRTRSRSSGWSGWSRWCSAAPRTRPALRRPHDGGARRRPEPHRRDPAARPHPPQQGGQLRGHRRARRAGRASRSTRATSQTLLGSEDLLSRVASDRRPMTVIAIFGPTGVGKTGGRDRARRAAARARGGPGRDLLRRAPGLSRAWRSSPAPRTQRERERAGAPAVGRRRRPRSSAPAGSPSSPAARSTPCAAGARRSSSGAPASTCARPSPISTCARRCRPRSGRWSRLRSPSSAPPLCTPSSTPTSANGSIPTTASGSPGRSSCSGSASTLPSAAGSSGRRGCDTRRR